MDKKKKKEIARGTSVTTSSFKLEHPDCLCLVVAKFGDTK